MNEGDGTREEPFGRQRASETARRTVRRNSAGLWVATWPAYGFGMTTSRHFTNWRDAIAAASTHGYGLSDGTLADYGPRSDFTTTSRVHGRPGEIVAITKS